MWIAKRGTQGSREIRARLTKGSLPTAAVLWATRKLENKNKNQWTRIRGCFAKPRPKKKAFSVSFCVGQHVTSTRLGGQVPSLSDTAEERQARWTPIFFQKVSQNSLISNRRAWTVRGNQHFLPLSPSQALADLLIYNRVRETTFSGLVFWLNFHSLLKPWVCGTVTSAHLEMSLRPEPRQASSQCSKMRASQMQATGAANYNL